MPSAPEPHVLVLSGPAGVGKTTVGWEISAHLRRARVAHVCLDSDELDRAYPLSNAEQERLCRSNLAAFWANAAALGHTPLVLTGVFLDLDPNLAWIAAAVPGARVTAVRLDASDEALRARVRNRETGSGLERQAARTEATATMFRHRPPDGRTTIDTTDRTVSDVAEEVLRHLGWRRQAVEVERPTPTVAVDVRPYRDDDHGAGRRLWEELTEHHRRLFADPTIGGDDPGSYFDDYLAMPNRVGSWVAVVDDEVVGLTGLLDHGRSAEVEPVIVTEGRRGRGIGSALIGRVVEEARSRGHEWLAIRPVARNTSAIARFHRAGFRTLGGHVDLSVDLAPRRHRPLPGASLHGLDFAY